MNVNVNVNVKMDSMERNCALFRQDLDGWMVGWLGGLAHTPVIMPHYSLLIPHYSLSYHSTISFESYDYN